MRGLTCVIVAVGWLYTNAEPILAVICNYVAPACLRDLCIRGCDCNEKAPTEL